jgi:hypothetical protein
MHGSALRCPRSANRLRRLPLVESVVEVRPESTPCAVAVTRFGIILLAQRALQPTASAWMKRVRRAAF